MNGLQPKGAPQNIDSQPNGSSDDIDTNLYNILSVTIVVFNYLILLPIFCVCTRFIIQSLKRENKDEQMKMIFRSRRPISLQWNIIITFIFFAIIQPFRLFDGSIPNSSLCIYQIPSWISSSIEYSITLAMILGYAQRSYLIYYDFNYHEAILNNEWKQFTSKHQSQLQWFLKNRNRFGNRIFTLYIITAIWLSLSCLLTLSLVIVISEFFGGTYSYSTNNKL